MRRGETLTIRDDNQRVTSDCQRVILQSFSFFLSRREFVPRRTKKRATLGVPDRVVDSHCGPWPPARRLPSPRRSGSRRGSSGRRTGHAVRTPCGRGPWPPRLRRGTARCRGTCRGILSPPVICPCCGIRPQTGTTRRMAPGWLGSVGSCRPADCSAGCSGRCHRYDRRCGLCEAA